MYKKVKISSGNRVLIIQLLHQSENSITRYRIINIKIIIFLILAIIKNIKEKLYLTTYSQPGCHAFFFLQSSSMACFHVLPSTKTSNANCGP